MTEEATPVKIFYCYARKDKRLRDELEKHLEPLRRSGQISAWYDREIQPGMDWKQEIDKHLNTSRLVRGRASNVIRWYLGENGSLHQAR